MPEKENDQKQWPGELARFRELQAQAEAEEDPSVQALRQLAASMEGVANILSQIHYMLSKGGRS